MTFLDQKIKIAEGHHVVKKKTDFPSPSSRLLNVELPLKLFRFSVNLRDSSWTRDGKICVSSTVDNFTGGSLEQIQIPPENCTLFRGLWVSGRKIPDSGCFYQDHVSGLLMKNGCGRRLSPNRGQEQKLASSSRVQSAEVTKAFLNTQEVPKKKNIHIDPQRFLWMPLKKSKNLIFSWTGQTPISRYLGTLRFLTCSFV